MLVCSGVELHSHAFSPLSCRNPTAVMNPKPNVSRISPASLAATRA
jgi:hypothetical protein